MRTRVCVQACSHAVEEVRSSVKECLSVNGHRLHIMSSAAAMPLVIIWLFPLYRVIFVLDLTAIMDADTAVDLKKHRNTGAGSSDARLLIFLSAGAAAFAFIFCATCLLSLAVSVNESNQQLDADIRSNSTCYSWCFHVHCRYIRQTSKRAWTMLRELTPPLAWTMVRYKRQTTGENCCKWLTLLIAKRLLSADCQQNNLCFT